MLKFVLLFFLISPSFQTCTSGQIASFGKCGQLIEDIGKSWEGTNKGVGLPKPEVARDSAEACKKAKDCMEKVKCVDEDVDEAKTMMNQTCQVIEFTNSELPCLQKFRETLTKAPNKHPCIKKNNIDLNARGWMCNMFTNAGWECAKPIIKDVCGQNKISDFEKGKILSVPMCTD